MRDGVRQDLARALHAGPVLEVGAVVHRLHGEQVAQLLELAGEVLLAHLLQRLDVLEEVMQRLLVLVARNQLQVGLLVQQVGQVAELPSHERPNRRLLVVALLLQDGLGSVPIASHDLGLDALNDRRAVRCVSGNHSRFFLQHHRGSRISVCNEIRSSNTHDCEGTAG